jgi:hypothetical protein
MCIFSGREITILKLILDDNDNIISQLEVHESFGTPIEFGKWVYNKSLGSKHNTKKQLNFILEMLKDFVKENLNADFKIIETSNKSYVAILYFI